MKGRVTLRLLSLSLATAASAFSFGFIAFDTATDAAYTAGQSYTGLNGGSGWNPWGGGGYGDNGNLGSTLITSLNPSFNMGAQQFGLRSGLNGADFSGADARRRLLNPLSVGNSISWSMMAGGNGAGDANTMGEFGAEIRSSLTSNPGRDMLTIIGETGRNWRVFRNGGTVESSVAVTAGQRVDVLFNITGNDTFDVTFTPFGGSGSTVSGTFLSIGQQIQTVQYYAYGTNGDFYVNDLEAVPEPATMAALGLGVAAMIRRRRKG